MEMEAMNALRKEPGFLGRMARVGEQMPMNTRDGIPAFWWGSDDDDDDSSSNNDTSSNDSGGSTWDSISDTVSGWGDSISDFFSGDPSGSGITENTTVGSGGSFNPTDSLSGLGGTTSGSPIQYDSGGNQTSGPGFGSNTNADNPIFNQSSGGSSGNGGRGGFDASAFQSQLDALTKRLDKSQADFENYQSGEEGRNQAAVDSAMTERDEGERQKRVDEFQGYKDRYKDLGEDADLSGYRDDMGGYRDTVDKYRGAVDQMTGEVKDKYAGFEGEAGKYRSAIDKMRDRAGDIDKLSGEVGEMRRGYDRLGSAMEKTGVDAQNELRNLNKDIRAEVAKGQAGMESAASDIRGYEGKIMDAAGRGESRAMEAAANMADTRGRMRGYEGRMDDLASQATDTAGLMKDRGLFAGQLEASRKASEEGNLANLRRSMAAQGASPADIARAESEARKGSGRAAREDALRASQMAMDSGRAGLNQAGGFLGAAGGMAGNQAGIAGSEGRLGMSGAGMGMSGASTGASLANTRAGLAGTSAGLGMSGLGQVGGNIGTGAGLAASGYAGAGNMLGAGINAVGMQGNMLGQAQGLNIQKTSAGLDALGRESGLYGTGVGARTGLMNMGSGLTQTGYGMTGGMQDSTLREIGAKSGLMGAEVGMTEAQLGDALDRINQRFQMDMSDKAYGADASAADARARAGEDAADDGDGGMIESFNKSWGGGNWKKRIGL